MRDLSETGIRPDPGKVDAIVRMQEPTNITELRRFLGMVNQLSKFSAQLAEKTKPLWELLSTRNHWVWGTSQQQAFDNMKADLSSSQILGLYDAKRPTYVSADASYGLGAVLKQEEPSSGEWRPVAYVSRAQHLQPQNKDTHRWKRKPLW